MALLVIHKKREIDIDRYQLEINGVVEIFYPGNGHNITRLKICVGLPLLPTILPSFICITEPR